MAPIKLVSVRPVQVIVFAAIIPVFCWTGIGEAGAQQQVPDFSFCATGAASDGYYCPDEGIAMLVAVEGTKTAIAGMLASPWNGSTTYKTCAPQISTYYTPSYGDITKIYIRVLRTEENCADPTAVDAGDRRYPSGNTCAARPPRTLAYTLPNTSLQCTDGCAYAVSGNGDGTSTALANGNVCTPALPPVIDPAKNNQCDV